MDNPYIGHNKPPEEMATDARAAWLVEAANWLDGTPVETDGQMESVDALLAEIKQIEKHTRGAKEVEFRPAKAIADGISDRFKKILSELDKDKKGLLGLVDTYKRKKHAEAERAQIEAEREAAEKARAAEMAKDMTDYSNLESRDFADDMALEARKAEQQAAAIAKSKPKGMRAYKVVEVTDPAAFWSWMQRNNPQHVQIMLAEAAKQIYKSGQRPDGVEERTEHRAT